MKAFLVLQDGTVFEGIHIGADKEIISEIVFSTSMAGYLEVLTDPSYAGKAVCMTYPLIGNYGVCREDMESERTWPDALIVRELSRIPSNFRSECTIQQFLEENGVPGIAGIDTRALTRLLREKGVMNGMITTNEHYNKEEIIEKLEKHTAGALVEKAGCGKAYTVEPVTDLKQNGPLFGSAHFDRESYEKGIREHKPSQVKALNGAGLKVALLDLGVKKSQVEAFAARGCSVTVYPASVSAEEILATVPDGIVISHGPGNPKEYGSVLEEVKKIYAAEIPVFGIGLGHQLLALAAGADTYKMKNGHRGGNYPVRDLTTGKVIISSQNHGYAVDTDKLDEKVAVPAFVNVNDDTNEGLSFTNKVILTVQFDPVGAGYLLDRFIDMMKGEN